MGMAHVIPQLLQRAHHAPPGGKLLVFSPEHTRTFCYVTDAVEIILRLALSPGGTDRTLNVGAVAEETTISELASLIAKTIGKKLTIERGPVTEGSAVRRRPDVSLASSITCYEAEVQLAEGIRRTYDWYRSHEFGS